MTKRLSAGVLLFALGAMLATTAYAERPQGREWRPGNLDPRTDSSVPLFFRSSAGTTWVSVGQNCAPGDTVGSNHDIDEVWCFEGAGGDSTWPNVPAGQNTGSKNETWNHWSKFAPPLPPSSKWQVSNFRPSGVGSDDNAFCGCNGISTGCEDVAFWVFQGGYGDDWNYALTLDMSGQNANSGGTIEFDVRYDTECNYDYLYLEYLNSTTSKWEAVTDTAGTAAIFNAVSGNPDSNGGGSGRECGDDIYGNSDQKDLGSGNEPYYGNSAWLTDVTFPLPAQSGGIQVRWRGFSDGAWSDADGRGDTDGIGAIDNVSITFTGSGSVVSDAFDSGDFNSPAATIGSASWTPGGLEGNTYDGWHLEFDPSYKNKGNTCTFSDDWMWAAKPASGPIPENGFSYYLVTPVIDCDGWTGGLVEYASYLCADDARDDFSNQLARFYDSSAGQWGLWQDFDGFITFGGCEFWNMNASDDLSTYLGADIDSLQVAYELLDICTSADFCWGKHGAVQYLIDNVSIGSFDGSATQFAAGAITIFTDTYSRIDPAHTPQLQNAEQGMWPTRGFATVDSLDVEVTDVDGITDGNVTIHWRISEVDPPVFGAWESKAMNFSQALAPPQGDQGVYRTTIGNDASEDYSGSTGDGLIWDAGSTIEYYVKAVDDLANPATTFPAAASDPDPAYFRFEVLPFAGRTVGADNDRILIVDDYTRLFLDFENSSGFEASGGAGFGNFTDPVFDQPEDMVERALGLLYGVANPESLPQWDIYDVGGAGSSVQCEPRVISQLPGLGGIGNDLGIPVYDAVIWLNGSFDAYSFADTTRLDLRTWLDSGGNLWSNGDDVARFLGSAGNDADSTIGFITDYFGMAFTNSADDATDSRVLNVVGEAGGSLDGCTFGLYGECPQRRAFDRISLAPAGANNTPSVLMTYSDGGAGDNGRVAVVKNQVFDSGQPTGVAIHSAFGLGALLSDASRATILSKTFRTDFGLTGTPVFDGGNNGVDAPVISGLAGFDLAGASPNPFNANTEISFTVPARSHVSIEVYNILGQKVRTLVDETLEGSSYVREWDGRTDNGERVSSGIYFYKMVAGQFSATQKAVLLK